MVDGRAALKADAEQQDMRILLARLAVGAGQRAGRAVEMVLGGQCGRQFAVSGHGMGRMQAAVGGIGDPEPLGRHTNM